METLTLPTRDIQAIARATQHLDALQLVEVNRTDDLLTLTWHPNGTTGAVVYHGEIVGDDSD